MNFAIRNPRHIFLIDGLGAALSGLLLVVLIAPKPGLFGLPSGVACGLSVPAFCLAAFSLSCFAFQPRKWRRQLRRIVLINLLYCLALVTILISYRDVITAPGFVYFLGECGLIATLAVLELRTLKFHADSQVGDNPAGSRESDA